MDLIITELDVGGLSLPGWMEPLTSLMPSSVQEFHVFLDLLWDPTKNLRLIIAFLLDPSAESLEFTSQSVLFMRIIYNIYLYFYSFQLFFFHSWCFSIYSFIISFLF